MAAAMANMAGFTDEQKVTLTQLFSNFSTTEQTNGNLDFRFGQQDTKYGDVLQKANEISATMYQQISEHRAELVTNAGRVDSLVQEANSIRAEIQSMVPQIQTSMAEQTAKSAAIDSKAEDLNGLNYISRIRHNVNFSPDNMAVPGWL